MEEEVNEEAPHSPSEEPSPETESAAQPKQEDFSKFYLRQVTAALADDLDKVRSASDFSDAKVGMLIRALTQGETVFSDDEKRRIMGGTS